jgi:hypothetical protein
MTTKLCDSDRRAATRTVPGPAADSDYYYRDLTAGGESDPGRQLEL